MKSVLDRIKGRCPVFSSGEYVVIPGTSLYILRPDGTLAASRKDLRHAGRVTFLSGDRMLLCTGKGVFHMIDLPSGQDLWTAPYTKFDLNAAKLAVSPDETFAYTYDEHNGHPFISRLDLNTGEVTIHEMHSDIGATRDIRCDEAGIPCLLKTLEETIGGQRCHQNGVRIHDFDGIAPGGTTNWKTKWYFEGSRCALRFLDGADRVITNDLHLYEPSTGTSIELLESESPDRHPLDCWPDSSGRYLCVKYLTANVVIDLKSRKIVARYAAEHTRGCLVGREYWIGTDEQIERRPFPTFEES